MRGLEGKNVLVTGTSSGIGQAIAVRFGQERAKVAINYAGHREGAEEVDTAGAHWHKKDQRAGKFVANRAISCILN